VVALALMLLLMLTRVLVVVPVPALVSSSMLQRKKRGNPAPSPTSPSDSRISRLGSAAPVSGHVGDVVVVIVVVVVVVRASPRCLLPSALSPLTTDPKVRPSLRHESVVWARSSGRLMLPTNGARLWSRRLVAQSFRCAVLRASCFSHGSTSARSLCQRENPFPLVYTCESPLPTRPGVVYIPKT
jgi:hypothetical protein